MDLNMSMSHGLQLGLPWCRVCSMAMLTILLCSAALLHTPVLSFPFFHFALFPYFFLVGRFEEGTSV